VQVFSLAESLGGVESLTNHPYTMTHASVPADRRAAWGITDGLVRLSIGRGGREDLIEDLDAALKGPGAERRRAGRRPRPGTRRPVPQATEGAAGPGGWHQRPRPP
jgi:hypothetical protein